MQLPSSGRIATLRSSRLAAAWSLPTFEDRKKLKVRVCPMPHDFRESIVFGRFPCFARLSLWGYRIDNMCMKQWWNDAVRRNRSIWRKPVPVPHYPPFISHVWPEIDPRAPRWDAGTTVNCAWNFSSYCAGNTFHLGYKNHSVQYHFSWPIQFKFI